MVRRKGDFRRPRYTHYKRLWKGAKMKANIEERFGDKTERAEKNLRNPMVTLDPDNKNMLCPDGKTRRQAWAVLNKCWFGFRIAKSKGNTDDMIKYAHAVRREQDNLGISLTEFTDPIELSGMYISEAEREYASQSLQ